MRLRPQSLGGRLTLLGALVMAGMLAVTAFALVTIQRHDLMTATDEGLRQRVDNVQTDIAAKGTATPLLGSDDTEDTFSQLLDANGTVVAASANLTGEPAVRPALAARAGDAFTVQRVSAISDSDFRVLAHRITGPRGAFTLLVGKNLDDVIESVHVLTQSLLVVCPLIVAVLALLIRWVTARTLRPVERIRAEVDRMSADDLDRRVPVPATDDEISRLARTMNALLDRLERAGRQQRRFTADASHEMRGPLTRLRSELELALAEPDLAEPDLAEPDLAEPDLAEPDRPGAARAGRDRNALLLADTVALQTLVEDLLFLARSEAQPQQPPADPVDLDDLVLAEARRLRAGGARVDTSGVGPARTRGEPRHLARALHNLADNAVRHAGSTVRLASRETENHCEITVSDDGPGIPPEHRETVFERFVRLDEARARDTGGSGLGLAIVKEIVTRHDGAVAISEPTGGGTRVTITLPRS